KNARGLADLAADLDFTGLHDVHEVSRRALVEQHRARREVAGEPLQSVVHDPHYLMVAWRRMWSSARLPTLAPPCASAGSAISSHDRPSFTARTSISTSHPSPRSRMPSATSAGNLSARTGPTPDQRWRYTVSITASASRSTTRRRPVSAPRTSSTPLS